MQFAAFRGVFPVSPASFSGLPSRARGAIIIAIEQQGGAE
ncbi:MAG: hypothetical protein OJF62_001759 [Pseudolabrys sp.]|nr:hypothetical protein [Pseudolabrys sp.]